MYSDSKLQFFSRIFTPHLREAREKHEGRGMAETLEKKAMRKILGCSPICVSFCTRNTFSNTYSNSKGEDIGRALL